MKKKVNSAIRRQRILNSSFEIRNSKFSPSNMRLPPRWPVHPLQLLVLLLLHGAQQRLAVRIALRLLLLLARFRLRLLLRRLHGVSALVAAAALFLHGAAELGDLQVALGRRVRRT